MNLPKLRPSSFPTPTWNGGMPSLGIGFLGPSVPILSGLDVEPEAKTI